MAINYGKGKNTSNYNLSISAATVRLCPAGLVLTLLTWDSG